MVYARKMKIYIQVRRPDQGKSTSCPIAGIVTNAAANEFTSECKVQGVLMT